MAHNTTGSARAAWVARRLHEEGFKPFRGPNDPGLRVAGYVVDGTQESTVTVWWCSDLPPGETDPRASETRRRRNALKRYRLALEEYGYGVATVTVGAREVLMVSRHGWEPEE